ncbi:hypothetical protein DASC09_041050 [Saccharomycopsis crataegensis]|uniref:Mitochondrial fission process protein 1 n=1 Tax=Saccharomycopsis crataegensis TaxID=43959 RepID=A0AAV5QQG3_9ASCO|nr:hypothetical protein DASC09_041050 [Saccharomycopsis crataegensis]
MTNPQDSSSSSIEDISHREGTDTTDTSLRYAAYTNRLRTILMASHRYIAYTSDIGESFRPVAHPYLVSFGYGISWAYILGDVGYEGWKAKMRKEGRYSPGMYPWSNNIPAKESLVAQSRADPSLPDWKEVALERGIFQSVASMGLPAFTIHSSVKYSAKYVFNARNFPKMARMRTFGPVAVGLAVVPVLPYLFDKPVEHAVGVLFAKTKETFGSKKLD